MGKRSSSVSVTIHSESTIDELEESSTIPLSMLHQQSTLSADETDIQGKVIQKRRPIKHWTQEEESLIERGVLEFGKGRWAEVKNKYFPDSDRTPTDIKDKYRNMTKGPK